VTTRETRRIGMGLFGAIVGTLVETAKLPISAVKEVGDVMTGTQYIF
jgi:hypothetical protein